MKPLNRLAATALALLAFSASAAAAPGDELLGCWTARRVVSHLQDGTAQEFVGQACTMHVQPGRIVTRCDSPKGGSQPGFSYEYRYQIVKPGLYRASMPASLGRPESVKDYHYDIRDDRLRITTYPAVPTPPPPTATVKVVSESQRTACAP